MLQMNQNYEPKFKKKIVHLHLEEGRSLIFIFAQQKNSGSPLHSSENPETSYLLFNFSMAQTIHSKPSRKYFLSYKPNCASKMNTPQQMNGMKICVTAISQYASLCVSLQIPSSVI